MDPPILQEATQQKIDEALDALEEEIPEYPFREWPRYLVGSMTGVQYKTASDIDIQMTAQEEIPDIIELRREIGRKVNDEFFVEEHPINFYVHEEGVFPPFAYVYDLRADNWVTDAPLDTNYYEEAIEVVEQELKEFIAKFDAELGETIRDIKDYKSLTDALQIREDKGKLLEILKQKKEEILWDVSVLLNAYEEVKQERREVEWESEEGFQLSDPNLKYKLLEHYGYDKLIHSLEDVSEQIESETPKVMANFIKRRKKALAYPGNLGFSEMMEFQDVATPEEKERMNQLLDDEEWDQVRILLNEVTDSQLEKFGHGYRELAKIVRAEVNVCEYFNKTDDTCLAIPFVEPFEVQMKDIQNGEYVWVPFKTMNKIREKGAKDVLDVCPFGGEPANEYDENPKYSDVKEDGTNKYCPYYKS